MSQKMKAPLLFLITCVDCRIIFHFTVFLFALCSVLSFNIGGGCDFFFDRSNFLMTNKSKIVTIHLLAKKDTVHLKSKKEGVLQIWKKGQNIMYSLFWGCKI